MQAIDSKNPIKFTVYWQDASNFANIAVSLLVTLSLRKYKILIACFFSELKNNTLRSSTVLIKVNETLVVNTVDFHYTHLTSWQ